MSLIDDSLFNYPLFSSSDIPIDLNIHNLTQSPPFSGIKKLSEDPNSPQIVPNNNIGNNSPPGLNFSLIMSGGLDKDFPLNANLFKGLHMTDDMNLFQSGLIQNPNKPVPVVVSEVSDNSRIVTGPSEKSGAPTVPEYSLTHTGTAIPKAEMAYDEPLAVKTASISKKRKAFPLPSPVSSPTHTDTQGVSSPIEGSQPSVDDERNMKRQRRLVKNREAAQLFRQRQKAYIQDLEKRVNDLSGSNNEYRARVELLNSENKLAKEQLLYLRNFVAQTVFPFPTPNSAGPHSDGSEASVFAPSGCALPPGMMNMSMASIQGLMAAMGPEYINPNALSMPGAIPIAVSPHLNRPPHAGISQGSASVPHTLNLMGNVPVVVRPIISTLPLSPVSCVPDSDDRAQGKNINVQMSR